MEKYYDKVSLFSRFVNFSFIFTKSKKNYLTEENTKKFMKKISNKKYNKKMLKRYGFKKENYSNIDVYSYNGTLENPNSKVLLYIHGGSFVEEAVSFQLKFAINIAKKTNSTLILPIYPLLPEGNYKTMYNLMYPMYKKIKSKDINLLGDSAGGGFILSFSMYLRDKKVTQPKNVVMLSPWLDLSMVNPELVEAEKLDYMSSIEGNKYVGRLWADDLDIQNYLVSPIYGTFENLPMLTIITGGRDILRPDCKLLSKKLKDVNICHNYIEYKGQGHDFGAYPTREGRLVIDDISNIINEVK